MMIRRAAIRLTFFLLLTPSTVCAAPAWYGDLSLGVGIAPDMGLNDTGAEAEFDIGTPIGAVAIGRTIGSSWRAELELGFLENELENYYWPTGEDAVRADARDGVRARSLLINGVRTFQVGALSPYVGLGVGMADVRLRMSREATVWPIEQPRDVHVSDSDDTFAWQAIAGFDVPLDDRWALGFDYRYWRASDLKVTAENGDNLKVTHSAHSARVHLRYFFTGEPPPAAPYPTPRGGQWKLSTSIGGGWAMDSEFGKTQDNLDAFSLGPSFILAAERRLTRRWSLELELAWRSSDVEVVDFGDPLGEFAASGRIEATSLAVNGLYQLRPDRAFRPYLGFGAGMARVDVDVETLGETYLDGRDEAPMLQLMGGVDIAMTERLDFTTEFRSWFAHPIELDRPDGSPEEVWHLVFSVQVGVSYAL